MANSDTDRYNRTKVKYCKDAKRVGLREGVMEIAWKVVNDDRV